MACKLCDQDKKLVKSHIIPSSFYTPLKDGGQVPKIITNKKNAYPQRSPTGVYDTILCAECENVFSPWDDYGHKFLMREVSDNAYIRDKGKKIACNMGQCDYKKLKLFFLSVLWRAGVSKQSMFEKVRLGPYAEKLRTCIRDENPGEAEDYAVTLSRFDMSPGEIPILCPNETKYEGVRHYCLYLGGYIARIKVTNKKTPAFLEGLYIAPGSDVLVLFPEYKNSKKFRMLVKLVKQVSLQEKRRGAPPPFRTP